MKVFLSWSTELSHKIAKEFRDWLPMVIQSIEPYVSSEDIDKGTRWSVDIATELQNSSFGILIVTLENLKAPWLNFEAGALSKAFDTAKVSPFLFNLRASDMTGSPLLQFQSTSNEKDDVSKLLHSINNSLGNEKLTEEKLNKTFDRWWPDLEAKLSALKQEYEKSSNEPKIKPKDKQQEILEELLEMTRSQQKLLNNPEALLPASYLRFVTKSEDELNNSKELQQFLADAMLNIRSLIDQIQGDDQFEMSELIEKLKYLAISFSAMRSSFSKEIMEKRRLIRFKP